MLELTQFEIDQVSGARPGDEKTVALATIAGAAMGSVFGPPGVLAGAASGFIHGLILTQLD